MKYEQLVQTLSLYVHKKSSIFQTKT